MTPIIITRSLRRSKDETASSIYLASSFQTLRVYEYIQNKCSKLYCFGFATLNARGLSLPQFVNFDSLLDSLNWADF